jgi:hypothetical protein
MSWKPYVCSGQYEKGLFHILDVFLKNIDSAQQPGVWVSGFFGSGKSHFVKILRALWNNTIFPDGVSARSLATLPNDIKAHLRELQIRGDRHRTQLHAAAGTLGAASVQSVRLALLGIIFLSKGLPEQYHLARFIMWLRREKLEEKVRAQVEANGYNWRQELQNFYVAKGLHEALVATAPNPFASLDVCYNLFLNEYGQKADVSSNEMLAAIKDALTHESGNSVAAKIPLSLIILDEVQQYIGPYPDRSNAVQEVVEACSKGFGGRLMFIGTGQTAVSGTPNLKQLEGRFTVRVELSDADVEEVVRKVILEKKPDQKKSIEDVMDKGIGEISRHLVGSAIAHRSSDIPRLAEDYPLLPIRTRFWEKALRILDESNVDSQLRNQLSVAHQAIQTNLDEPLGTVIPTDFLFFHSLEKLLQSRALPRTLYDQTKTWNASEDMIERFKARVCGIVFFINKIKAKNDDIGLKATSDTIADLLLEKLSEGSGGLRKIIPEIADNCELLMKVDDEYHIQTEDSLAWNDEFQAQKQILIDKQIHGIDTERNERISQLFLEAMGGKAGLNIFHGVSKVSRQLRLVFEKDLPSDEKNVQVWVRDGWNSSEDETRAEAINAGQESSTIFVFIPKRSADKIHGRLLDFLAAQATLEKRGVPGQADQDALTAQSAMKTKETKADITANNYIKDSLAQAVLFQGGGSQIEGDHLKNMILKASQASLARLYPNFEISDHEGWPKVYERVKKGAFDALKGVGHQSDPADHKVCVEILKYLGRANAGYLGKDVRKQFESPPYGWSGDCVDAALLALLATGKVKASNNNHKELRLADLERKNIGISLFQAETTTLSAKDRLDLRKLFKNVGLTVNQDEDLLPKLPDFLKIFEVLAKEAGGEPPKPPIPSSPVFDLISLKRGNAQLLAALNAGPELTGLFEAWKAKADLIADRWPKWLALKELAAEAQELTQAQDILRQIKAIEEGLQLLDNPDPTQSLLADLRGILREEAGKLSENYDSVYNQGLANLNNDKAWLALEPNQRESLLAKASLTKSACPEINLGTNEGLIKTLKTCSLKSFNDKVAALPNRFEEVAIEAARLLEPRTRLVRLPSPSGLFKTEADIDSWLEEARKILKEAVRQGPVKLG